MKLLYNIGVWGYFFFIVIASKFNSKARLWVLGRKNWRLKLTNSIGGANGVVWIHCASLGEFEQGRPILEELKKSKPDLKILLTFFSPSGYEIRKKYPSADFIYYLPLDTSSNAEDFIEIVKPSVAIFVKYEFWFHYLNTLNQKKIPTYLVSAIFRSNQHFFKWYGSWWRKILRFYNFVFVQNESSAELLKGINIFNYKVAGDTRFDRVFEIAEKQAYIPLIERFINGNKVRIVVGSSWPSDENILAQYINLDNSSEKYIIAPHEITESRLYALEKLLERKSIRYSQLSSEKKVEHKVLIIDNIGMLSSLYKYGEVAYVGGGFGKGIHNILEAAVYGMPVIFGPNYKKFHEAMELIELKGAFSINNFDEFQGVVNRVLNVDKMDISKSVTRNYVLANIGATKTIIEKISL